MLYVNCIELLASIPFMGALFFDKEKRRSSRPSGCNLLIFY